MPILLPNELPDTIPEAFAAVAREASDSIALQMKQGDAYQRYTYGDVAKQVQALTAALVDMGLRPGDRAALVAENRPEWAIVYLSIVTAGATVVPLDIQMPEEELAVIIAESGSRLVFASAQTCRLVTRLPSGARLVNMDAPAEADQVTLSELLGMPSRPSEVTLHPDDVASLLYTSGTTKRPKGVLLTHRNFMANAKALMTTGLASREDNFLVMLPLHHAYPFMITFLVPLLLGARMTFLQSLKGPDLLQCLRDTQVNIVVAVPQMFAMIRRGIFEELRGRPAAVRLMAHLLLSMSGVLRQLTGWNLGRRLFGPIHKNFGQSLRLLVSGGAKLDSEVARDLTRLGFTILEGYGLTETAPVLTFTPLKRPKARSVGLPISNVEVRILNPDETGVGEVAARGPNVMKGYDRAPEATAEVIRDGWFHTGDLGYVDHDGYLFLTGRLKELIVTAGGKNIIPEELEAQYQQSPAIKELCLVARKREGEEGETLHAVVVPDIEYLKAQKILDTPIYIKDQLNKVIRTLPPYKRITGVSLITEPLPRTRLGKIRRHLVTAMVESGKARREARPAVPKADQELLETITARDVLATLATLLPAGKEIHIEDHLDLDLGLDSLKRVELVVALEKQFGSLPENFAVEIVTVRDLIEKLRSLEQEGREGPGAQRTWQEIVQTAPPRAVTEALLAVPSPADRIATRVGLALLNGLFRGMFNLTVKGQEHVPERGPFLLAANHASFLDPFVLLVAVPRSVFSRLFSLGWEAYFHNAFTAWIARIGHVISLGPETPLVTVLQASAAVIREGKCLLIFPEGERSINGRLLPFKKGIGVLACELGVPVVPVRIEGSFEAWPADARLPRFRSITVRFGKSLTISPPMMTEWIASGEDPHQAAANVIREAVASLSSKPES